VLWLVVAVVEVGGPPSFTSDARRATTTRDAEQRRLRADAATTKERTDPPEDNAPAGWSEVQAVATLVVGDDFYRTRLLPLWLHALRSDARWLGPVYFGCDACGALRASLEALGETRQSVVLVPMSRAVSGIAAPSADGSHHPGPTGKVRAARVGEEYSFHGKGASRAAKASKWRLALDVTALIEANGLGVPAHGTAQAARQAIGGRRDAGAGAGHLSLSTSNGTARRHLGAHLGGSSGSDARVLFLDVDALATADLPRWLAHSAGALAAAWPPRRRQTPTRASVGPPETTVSTTGAPVATVGVAPSSGGGPGCGEDDQGCGDGQAALSPDLFLVRGRRWLGEPFNTGLFLFRGAVDAAAGSACLALANGVVARSSVGTSRLRPRLNDQEALRRLLARNGGPNGTSPGTGGGANGDGQGRRTCTVRYLPSGVLQFASSGAVVSTLATWAQGWVRGSSEACATEDDADDGSDSRGGAAASRRRGCSAAGPPRGPGVVHFTQARKRTDSCARRQPARKQPALSQAVESAAESAAGSAGNAAILEGGGRGNDQGGGREGTAADDAPTAWLAARRVSGVRRRGRPWWRAAVYGAAEALGLGAARAPACLAPYRRLAERMDGLALEQSAGVPENMTSGEPT